MFKAAYESAWQHPGIAFIAGVPLLLFGAYVAVLARRSHDRDPRRRAWLRCFFVLQIAILVDAYFTGAWSPLVFLGLAPNGAAAEAAAAVFVVLGDLRFFYLVERQRGEIAAGARAMRKALAVALPVSLLVPASTAVAKQLWPTRMTGTSMYLAYELALIAVAVTFAVARAPRVSDKADHRRAYVRRLLVVELATYALWSLADVAILRGYDWGYLVRMIPNAIYYAAFVPLATLGTPAGSRT